MDTLDAESGEKSYLFVGTEEIANLHGSVELTAIIFEMLSKGRDKRFRYLVPELVKYILTPHPPRWHPPSQMDGWNTFHGAATILM
jgi:hypothetical protein